MGENDAGVRGQLIPELPEELVLAHVIPRLPWYTRPLCRALSTTWRSRLDTRNPELDLRTRMIQLPLLRGLFLFCTFDKHIFIRDPDVHEQHRIGAYQIEPHWRKLPPLQGLVMASPSRTTMLASSGMVYVWSATPRSNRQGADFILKLDMGCADWTWKKLPVPYAFNSDAVAFHDKIYVPRISVRSSAESSSQKKVVLVHDMVTDNCTQVETWNQDDLRIVLAKSPHSYALAEDMYGFVEENFAEKLGVVMYDASSDSWRTREEVPIPEFRWSHRSQVMLLNDDCFEPAPETAGINIIWIDHESNLLSWFNSPAGVSWEDICFESLVEGKHLEKMEFIRGSMYGLFCEGKDDDDDDEEEEEEEEKEEDDAVEEEENGQGLSILPRRMIMKGRIDVASNCVAWKEVHEIGVFKKSYHVDCTMIRPIDSYTTMA